MVAWRRCAIVLALLALPMAGTTGAFAASPEPVKTAQAQAQPAPQPTPTPATPQAPAATPAADAQSAADEPIGNVATVTGIATVIRNKNSISLKVRDDIYLNDIVQTSSKSSLGITFNDATTFNLSANARITIDNYVYEDGGKQNAAIFDIGKGTIAFVAAAVAKTGDMKITTPTAALGIRGTTGVVEVPEGAAANAANNVNIKLYPDADGRVGRIEVDDRVTGGRLGFLTRAASGFAIRPGTGGVRFAAVPITIAPQQVLRDQSFVRQVHATQTTGRQIVTEQRAFRRNNPGLNNLRPGQPGQLQRQNGGPGQLQKRPNGLPGQNRTTPQPPATPKSTQPLRRRGGAVQPGTPRIGQGQQGVGSGQPTGAPRTGQNGPVGRALNPPTARNGAGPPQPPATSTQPPTAPNGQTLPQQPPAATQPSVIQPQRGGLLRQPGQITRPAPRKPPPATKKQNELR